MTASGWKVFDASAAPSVVISPATDLYSGPYGPTRSAMAFAGSPLGMFFYFLPKSLWKLIADETNRYRTQSIPVVAQQRHAKMLARKVLNRAVRVKDVTEIEDELKNQKPIEAHEIVHWIGLLISHTLVVFRSGVRKHWSTESGGANPRGMFGSYKFEDTSRFLHFNNNSAVFSSRDRAVKIRPVLNVLQKTFRRGYRLGPRISFDEGMIPSCSRFNPIRVYMAAKPNKWGTKFFLTCCAETAYCSRLEVYCGKEDVAVEKAIPTVVVRNVTKALKGSPGKRVVVTDNYYSSVALSLNLLSMGLYHVGTVRTNRLGWCKEVTYTQKSRPKSIPRGTYRLAQSTTVPELVAVSWLDSRPVNFLATGCATQPSSVTRREKDGSVTDVPCPQLVADYHKGMGGVDVHDQLQLQRYSLQKCLRFRKYCKALFLGLVDMALINGFILHKIAAAKQGNQQPTHAEYMDRLHKQLLAVTKADFSSYLHAEDLMATPSAPTTHVLKQNTSMYEGGASHRMRRRHLCKVCSDFSLKNAKSYETSSYCEDCTSRFGGLVALCPVVRRTDQGNTLTCSQIWHGTWSNGTTIPAALRSKIRFHKRKQDDESEDEEQE